MRASILQDVMVFLEPTLFLATGLLITAMLGWFASIWIVGLPRLEPDNMFRRLWNKVQDERIG